MVLPIVARDVKMILGVDLGGTWTRWAKVDRDGQLFSQGRERTSDLSHLMGVLKSASQGVDGIGIGLAGPVLRQKATLTNLGWSLCAQDMREKLGYPVFLMNDLAALAAGIPYLGPADFDSLNDGSPEERGVHAVIAVGTGLGQGFLVPDESQGWTPCASEGGHCDFSPSSALQVRLLEWMWHQHDHVSWERLVSGTFGFANLHRFFVESESMVTLSEGQVDGARVLQAAKENHPTALAVVRLMCELLAAEAGNMALKTLCTGGLWIAGGVAPRLLEWMKEKSFSDSFLKKGRFESLMKSVPVRVILKSEDCALKGAGANARRLMPQQ